VSPFRRRARCLTIAALLPGAAAALRAQEVPLPALAVADSAVRDTGGASEMARLFGEAEGAPDADAALLGSATLDAGELEIERLRFLAWLGDSAASLDARGKERAAEHLHYLIASAARMRVEAGEPAWPAADDADLAALFAWRARLGAFGAGLAARALGAERDAPDAAPVPVLLPAPPLHLSLEEGEWVVRSTGAGWSLRAPWYLAVEHASTSRASNGTTTEKLVLATPFGEHADGSGESRGTILVVAARTRDREAFEEFWVRSLGAADSTRVAEAPLSGARAFVVRDPRWHLVTEVVALDLPGGAMVLAFAAVEGAYESQRPAFAALLRALRKGR
jgi:hypothetical protein